VNKIEELDFWPEVLLGAEALYVLSGSSNSTNLSFASLFYCDTARV